MLLVRALEGRKYGERRVWPEDSEECLLSDNRRKSNQESKLGRTGYKGRIMINNVRKARRKKKKIS